MRKIAIEALRSLANDIVDGVDHWTQVDKIERRFKLQGFTHYTVKRMQNEREAYVEKWIAQNVPWDRRFRTNN